MAVKGLTFRGILNVYEYTTSDTMEVSDGASYSIP